MTINSNKILKKIDFEKQRLDAATKMADAEKWEFKLTKRKDLVHNYWQQKKKEL